MRNKIKNPYIPIQLRAGDDAGSTQNDLPTGDDVENRNNTDEGQAKAIDIKENLFEDTVTGSGGGPKIGSTISGNFEVTQPNFENQREADNFTSNIKNILSDTSLPGKSLGERVAKWIGETSQSDWLKPVRDLSGAALGNGPALGTVSGATLGGLLGLGAGGILSAINPQRGRGMSKWLGLGGAGLGAYLSYLISRSMTPNTKVSYTTYPASPDEMIRNKLMRDPDLSTFEKSSLLDLVAGLSFDQKDQLAKIVSSTFSGGVGFLIAKFLLNQGVTSSVIIAILGSVIGYNVGGISGPRDAGGNRVLRNEDSFGRQRYF